jgi:hypothetical protein
LGNLLDVIRGLEAVEASPSLLVTNSWGNSATPRLGTPGTPTLWAGPPLAPGCGPQPGTPGTPTLWAGPPLAPGSGPRPGAPGTLPSSRASVLPARASSKWRARRYCPDSYIFKEKCGHGSWRWRRSPCMKWSCRPCSEARISEELVPELFRAMEWGLSMGVALKFLTLTWQGKSLAAQRTPEGAKARARHIEYLVRWIRRRAGGYCHYLRVSETHKSGAVHVHMVVLMRKTDVRVLSRQWMGYTKDSFKVDIRYLYSKCPTPGCTTLGKRGKRTRSRIIPQSSETSGKCFQCGFTPDWSNPDAVAAVAVEAARYVGKYLTKQGDIEGLVRKMNRTQEWNKVCRPDEETPQVACADCGDEHAFEFVGSEARLIEQKYVGLGGATTTNLVAYHAVSSTPCYCWNPRKWREGRADAEHGLWDLLEEAGKQEFRGRLRDSELAGEWTRERVNVARERMEILKFCREFKEYLEGRKNGNA